MFSKVIAACIVATALGQAAVRPLQQSQSATSKSIRQLDQSLKATATEIGDVVDSDAFTKNMKTVDSMVIDYAAVRGELDAAGTGYDRTIANNKNELGRTIAVAGDELDLQLENALDEITAALAAIQDDVDTTIMVRRLLPGFGSLSVLARLVACQHGSRAREIVVFMHVHGGAWPQGGVASCSVTKERTIFLRNCVQQTHNGTYHSPCSKKPRRITPSSRSRRTLSSLGWMPTRYDDVCVGCCLERLLSKSSMMCFFVRPFLEPAPDVACNSHVFYVQKSPFKQHLMTGCCERV
jgi:hypothetical protein